MNSSLSDPGAVIIHRVDVPKVDKTGTLAKGSSRHTHDNQTEPLAEKMSREEKEDNKGGNNGSKLGVTTWNLKYEVKYGNEIGIILT